MLEVGLGVFYSSCGFIFCFYIKWCRPTLVSKRQ